MQRLIIDLRIAVRITGSQLNADLMPGRDIFLWIWNSEQEHLPLICCNAYGISNFDPNILFPIVHRPRPGLCGGSWTFEIDLQ